MRLAPIDKRYSITEDGRLWDKQRSVFSKQSTNRGGFLTVRLHGQTAYPHRLVAERWCPNPGNHKHVRHIDGNQYNNHYSNLEWYNPGNHKVVNPFQEPRDSESRKEMVLRIAEEYMEE